MASKQKEQGLSSYLVDPSARVLIHNGTLLPGAEVRIILLLCLLLTESYSILRIISFNPFSVKSFIPCSVLCCFYFCQWDLYFKEKKYLNTCSFDCILTQKPCVYVKIIINAFYLPVNMLKICWVSVFSSCNWQTCSLSPVISMLSQEKNY